MPMRRVTLRDLEKAHIVEELNIVLAKHGMIFVTEQGPGSDFDRMWIEYATPRKQKAFIPWGMGLEGPEDD